MFEGDHHKNRQRNARHKSQNWKGTLKTSHAMQFVGRGMKIERIAVPSATQKSKGVEIL